MALAGGRVSEAGHDVTKKKWWAGRGCEGGKKCFLGKRDLTSAWRLPSASPPEDEFLTLLLLLQSLHQVILKRFLL